VELTTVWFCLIAVLWVGYLVLEGFDFGVGMLLTVLGRDDTERRALINTIGPVWDGNEVWLIVAGGATFAAFPEWYATLFSGFYLPLLVILVALILRGVAFEYRGKIDDRRWRRRWDTAIVVGSVLPALLWGVAWANIVQGVPIDASREYTGSLFTLLNPYGLLGGVTTLALFLLHGAVFLTLRTSGDIRDRAGALATRLSLPVLSLVVVFALWTQLSHSARTVTWALVALLVATSAGALVAIRRHREGIAFTLSAGTIATMVVLFFTALFPAVMPSSTEAAFSLTVHNAASTPYTLKIMTWVAVALLPFVLAYQTWTYWVFRHRIGVADIPLGAGLPWKSPTDR
jgi:cytochrome bd ubiquinol oxidase subunit II